MIFRQLKNNNSLKSIDCLLDNRCVVKVVTRTVRRKVAPRTEDAIQHQQQNQHDVQERPETNPVIPPLGPVKEERTSVFAKIVECFKENWKTHKVLHKLARGTGETNGDAFNPWPNYRYTGKLRPFRQSNRRSVPKEIGRPDYADHPEGIPISEQKMKPSAQIKTLSDEEIEGMRVACKLGREVLEEASKVIGVGVTTDEIDRIVHEACIERDCYPSPFNYYQFPRSCCTSVNEVICHGIPDLRPLENGDICNVDITVYHRGFHGDLNETFLIGEVSDTAKKLTKVTWECLQKAIDIVRPGEKYREIGNVIQKHAQAHGFSVVRSYCGHGIHQLFHTAPSIPHYAKNKAVGVMKPGHCFTIEPMISQGSWRDDMWPDKWTAVTVDGLLSAQFEHTLLVTANGCDVLTARRTNNGLPYFMDTEPNK